MALRSSFRVSLLRLPRAPPFFPTARAQAVREDATKESDVLQQVLVGLQLESDAMQRESKVRVPVLNRLS